MVRQLLFRLLLLWSAAVDGGPCFGCWVAAFSSSPSSLHYSKAQLLTELQRSATPDQLLDRVGRHVSPSVDPDGSLSSLVLVRLSKQLIAIDNSKNRNEPLDGTTTSTIVDALTTHLASSKKNDWTNVDSLVEGTKACAILARLLENKNGSCCCAPLADFWKQEQASDLMMGRLQEHHFSGLQWAFDCFRLVSEITESSSYAMPKHLDDAVTRLNLPFRIRPGLLNNGDCVVPSVAQFESEVDFRVDEIRTTASNKMVRERRQTAWQGDDDGTVGPFCYSGKEMPRSEWTPTVRQIRNQLDKTMGQYYNGCLLNLYPDGQSGMRYHKDPDQGSLWDYDTAVVSVGATRRFAFRHQAARGNNASKTHNGGAQPHNFVVMHGDVVHMFDDCQERFQHTVKNADQKKETSPRVSLVYKRTWEYGKM